MLKRFLLVALLGLPTLLFATGKIYTWTDEDGNVFYGDRPPTQVEATEIAIQGKKKKPVIVDEQALPGEWFGTDQDGGEVKMTLENSGNIDFRQTQPDQTVYIYQGIWSYNDKTITVITEYTQTAPPGSDFQRSIEPIQLQYNIIAFGGDTMELIIEDERFEVARVDFGN